ncbi:MAG: hypothetical protein WD294_02350 [Phycisphaeraceae bacterium]
MIQITPRMFFSAKPVRKAADRATRAVLSKAGAFVRRTARSSIRRRKRTARPGEPPSSHKGHLRRLIFFGYERQRRIVVVGPAPLGRRSPYGPTTVPEVLEEGGTVAAREDGERVRRRYRGHPFMGPAMEKELPKFPTLWKDSIRR